ncbi:MAG TPA: response regulator [Kofleriaceae bacterium]|jgi:two-component system chemotaxis response regulator CheY|nr:response regulator [Kofleriaceae bacterium]
MRALIVDDSRTMRTILGRIVAGLGFEVAQAGDGKQALAQLAAGPVPELMLADWNMPEMTGYELVCAVRAVPAYAAIKIVMVTTETETSQVASALDAGANEYVMKPFTPEIILDKLRMLGLAGG